MIWKGNVLPLLLLTRSPLKQQSWRGLECVDITLRRSDRNPSQIEILMQLSVADVRTVYISQQGSNI